MKDLLIVLGFDILAMIFLAMAFANIERNEDLKTQEAKDRNDKWHWQKLVALMLFFAAISYKSFGFDLNGLIFLASQTSLNVIVFNPAINLFKKTKGGFFYLSDEGPEGWFKKYEVAYYFGFLSLFLGSLFYLYFQL